MRGSFSTSNFLRNSGGLPTLTDQYAFTCVVSVYFDASPGTVIAHWGNSATNWKGYYFETNASGVTNFVSADSFKKATITIGTSAYHTLVGRNSTNTLRSIFADGVKGTDDATNDEFSVQYNSLLVGGSNPKGTPTNPFDGYIGNVAWYDGALTDAECLSLSDGFSPLLVRPHLLVGYYPLLRGTGDGQDIVGGYTLTETGTVAEQENGYRFISPAPVFYSFPAAAGAGVSVDVPLGTLTITGLVPVVSTGVQVAVPAGSLVITGEVPSVGAGASVAVPAGSLAITGQVPTVSTGVQVSVPAGSLAITGLVPAVQTGMAINVPAGSLAITGQVPIIATGASVAVPAGSLAITGQVPTVSTGVSVAVPAGSLAITGYIPTITVGGAVQVDVPVGALAITGLVPSVSTGVQVAVPVGSLAITGLVPTVSTGVSVAVPAGALAITGLVPVVTTGAVTITVPAGTLTITGYVPLVTSYNRTGLLAQIHEDIDDYYTTYDNLSRVLVHSSGSYRGIFQDVSTIGLQGGTNARDGPWVVMRSEDVDGTISYGDTVTIYSKDWTVEGIQPDIGGNTKLVLIPAS